MILLVEKYNKNAADFYGKHRSTDLQNVNGSHTAVNLHCAGGTYSVINAL